MAKLNKKYYWGKADPNRKSKSYPEGNEINSDVAAYDDETEEIIPWSQRQQYDFSQPPTKFMQKDLDINQLVKETPNVLPEASLPSFLDILLYLNPSGSNVSMNFLFNTDFRNRLANFIFNLSSGDYGDWWGVPFNLLNGLHYDGRLHDPNVDKYGYVSKNPVKERNYVNAYTLKDFTGFEPSSIGRGRYSTGRFSNAPAVNDKFYTDTLFLPNEMKQDFMNHPISGQQIDKDKLDYIPGTYDARNHGYTTEPKTQSILFEDVFDVDPENVEGAGSFGKAVASYVNAKTTPIIVNQRVPVVFTDNTTKFKTPKLIERIKSDLKK